MKTAISVPDATFARVEQHARKLGISRSEFFAKAAERWADDLEGADLTAAINRSLANWGEHPDDEASLDFVRRASRRTLAADKGEWD